MTLKCLMLLKSAIDIHINYVLNVMLSICINKMDFPLFLALAKIIYRDTNSSIEAINHKSQYLTAARNLIVAYI